MASRRFVNRAVQRTSNQCGPHTSCRRFMENLGPTEKALESEAPAVNPAVCKKSVEKDSKKANAEPDYTLPADLELLPYHAPLAHLNEHFHINAYDLDYIPGYGFGERDMMSDIWAVYRQPPGIPIPSLPPSMNSEIPILSSSDLQPPSVRITPAPTGEEIEKRNLQSAKVDAVAIETSDECSLQEASDLITPLSEESSNDPLECGTTRKQKRKKMKTHQRRKRLKQARRKTKSKISIPGDAYGIWTE